MVDPRVADTSGRTSALLVVDLCIVVGLGVAALLLRRNLPTDGLFYDDAWQALGVREGSLGNILTVGQTQPGWALELMAWSRIAGTGARAMVVPAMVAGCLGPPALYLTLRRFRFSRPIAVVLGSLLAVSTTHIMFSNHVKSYTTDVLWVLLISLVVSPLAPRRWGLRTAVAWFALASVLAAFSSMILLATGVAGLVLLVYGREDRMLRLAAVGGQALVSGILFFAISRTYNARKVAGFFGGQGGFVDLDADPVQSARVVGSHLMNVADVFTGGPKPWLAACVLITGAGLLSAAWKGPRRVAARFFMLLVGAAFVGSVAHRVPFGTPAGYLGRVTLWLVPAVALGLAVAMENLRDTAAGRVRGGRILDVLILAGAGALLLTSVGERHPYPPAGAESATRKVMADLGPRNVVWVTRPTTYSFALAAGLPVGLQPSPDRSIGFLPRFEDRRIQLTDFGEPAEKLAQTVEGADRVIVIHAMVQGPAYTEMVLRQEVVLMDSAFELETSTVVGEATISSWRRADSG